MRCENCVSLEVCFELKGRNWRSMVVCKHFKDKTFLFELPCRVGDEFWIIREHLNSTSDVEKRVCRFKVKSVGFIGKTAQIKGVYFPSNVSYSSLPLTVTVGKDTMKKFFFSSKEEASERLSLMF